MRRRRIFCKCAARVFTHYQALKHVVRKHIQGIVRVYRYIYLLLYFWRDVVSVWEANQQKRRLDVRLPHRLEIRGSQKNMRPSQMNKFIHQYLQQNTFSCIALETSALLRSIPLGQRLLEVTILVVANLPSIIVLLIMWTHPVAFSKLDCNCSVSETASYIEGPSIQSLRILWTWIHGMKFILWEEGYLKFLAPPDDGLKCMPTVIMESKSQLSQM